jgi:hypothetical protein
LGFKEDRYYYIDADFLLPPFPPVYEESPRTTENRVVKYGDEKKGTFPTPPRKLFVARRRATKEGDK